MIVCVRGQSRRRADCAEDGCDREHVALCDYTVTPRGRRCSRRMCARHRTRQPGDDLDYCPRHITAGGGVPLRAAAPLQLGLGDQLGLSHMVNR